MSKTKHELIDILNDALIKRRDLTYKLMLQIFIDDLDANQKAQLDISQFKQTLSEIAKPKINQLAEHNIQTIFKQQYLPKIEVADGNHDDDQVNELAINGVIATFNFKYKHEIKCIIEQTYQNLRKDD